jgi:hypothetical protein
MEHRSHQLAWLAGLIDGERCFSIEGRKAYIRIVLQERDRFVLERVQEIAGGRLNFRPVRAELLELCKGLLPFLVLKKGRCEEVIYHIELLEGI